MSDSTNLQELLTLKPLEVESITFAEYLSRLKDHPEMGMSAPSVLLRAIANLGEVDINEAPVERRPYLRMLKKMRISSFKAFDKVKGSQKTVARIMNHLAAAASNGYQLHLAIVLKGAPGSGKSFLSETIKDALEGQIVYAIDGCPIHENPINLLNLLDRNTVTAIAKSIGMDEETAKTNGHLSLKDLLAASGSPCKTCWSQVMEGEHKDSPNLANVKIKALRISSRKFGIGTWLSDEPLENALRRGSRGLVSIPEMFSKSLGSNGKSNKSELDVMLTATNDRRIALIAGVNGKPSNSFDVDDDNTTWLPLDAVIVGETNDGEYDQFIKNHPDPNKFTRRFYVMNVPYNTSVSEEELAYRDFLANMPKLPHFDPMALKMLALFGVISRLKKAHEVDIVSRARMYDGEELVIEKKAGTSNLASGSGSGPNSGKPERKFWSVQEFWAQAGDDEGMSGLSMPLMLGAISQLVEIALKSGSDKACASSLDVLGYLKAKVKQLKSTPGITKQEEEVYANCEEYLSSKEPNKPGILEAEYRRVLRRQFLEVMAPEFEDRASEIFAKYRDHANAFARGDRTVETVSTNETGYVSRRKVEVDTAFLSDVEKWMGISSFDEQKAFRMALEAEILSVVRSQMAKPGDKTSSSDEDSSQEDVTISWRTFTKLAQGITAKLNDMSAQRLERILKPEIELSDDDRILRKEVFDKFESLGYCPHCVTKAITYFKDYQLWKQS